MEEASPKSLRFATCLYKPDVVSEDLCIDWIGFNIDNYYVVGYGLDLNQIYRGLPGIYAVNKGLNQKWKIIKEIKRKIIVSKIFGKLSVEIWWFGY